MAKSKKSKPSFDLPAARPAASAKPGETGWVYRSDAVKPPPATESRKSIASASKEAAPATSAVRATTPAAPVAPAGQAPPATAGRRTAMLAVDRVVGWITLPIQIAVMVALVPFRSK
jgi:hypothetical protein